MAGSFRVPNIPGTLQNWVRKKTFPMVLWTGLPLTFAPDLESLGNDALEARMHFYVSLLIISFSMWLLFGTLLLWFRNSRADGKNSKSYEALPLTGKNFEKDVVADFLKKRGVIQVCVFIYLLSLMAALSFCLSRGNLSKSLGVGWEFWLVWLNCGMALGVVEVVILFWKPGKRAKTLYVKAMVLAHAPLLSERVDTSKDSIFIFVALHYEEYEIAGAALLVLFISHAVFVYREAVWAELLETYLPILTSPIDDGEDKQFRDKVVAFSEEQALKQTSPARGVIGKWEDLPQGVLMCVFTIRQGGSIFVYVGVAMSLLRLCLSLEFIGGKVNSWLLATQVKKLLSAMDAGNFPKVKQTLELVLAVDPNKTIQDLRKYSASECRGYEIPAYVLLNASFSVQELTDGGFSTEQLVNAGCSLKDVGWSAKQLNDVGYSAKELRDYGFSAEELKDDAGFAEKQLKDAGYSAKELKNAGFAAKQLKDAGYSAEELKDAGYSAEELKDAGFAAKELKDVGYSAEQLKQIGFPSHGLKDAGWSAKELKDGGYSAEELRDVGYGGFPAKELKKAGWSAQELWDAGYPAEELEELWDAGFAAKAFKLFA